MKGRQWFLVGALGVAAAIAISGSAGWMDHTSRDDSFTATRERFERALHALDARIDRIRAMPAGPADSTASLVLPANLAERSAQIAATLDSIESVDAPQRMGAIAGLRANLAELGIESFASVVAGDVPAAVRRLGRAGERFDLVLVDPPYASEEPVRAFEALVGSAVLCAGAMVVLERDRRHPSPGVAGLAALDERRYGDTVLARFVAGESERSEPTGAGG